LCWCRAYRASGSGLDLQDGVCANVYSPIRASPAPHVPHQWENGFMIELSTRTFLCGDLFTQGSDNGKPITDADILGPSEAFRAPMDYYAHAPQTAATLERLAREQPQVLACMHGSAWRGDGAALLRALARALTTRPGLAAVDVLP
jgi:hypothetical protein